MKKYVKDLKIVDSERLPQGYVLLKLRDEANSLPPMLPGQFVQVRIDNTPDVMLRRPISVNFVDISDNTLWLLVHAVGPGTAHLATLREGDMVNCLFPLGNSFSMSGYERPLLVGGGVGTAPMLFLGAGLKAQGITPTFLLGGRTAKDVLQLDEFAKYGRVCVTTEDGSLDTKGFVTQHPVLEETFDFIATCGPKPMMKAVAAFAKAKDIRCEVSLENLMACGLGACLCCVEKTTTGHRCVCTEGPVFNTNELDW